MIHLFLDFLTDNQFQDENNRDLFFYKYIYVFIVLFLFYC